MIYIIIILIIINYLCISLFYNEIKSKKEIEKINNILKNKIYMYELEMNYLRNIANNKLKNIKFKTNEEILDAVKYARKHAHPDNGGNPRDFHRFCNLYEKLTK